MIVGAYTLHLYCVNSTYSGNNFPTCKNPNHLIVDYHLGNYSAETQSECRKIAKKDGWKFVDGDVICKFCHKGNRK